MVDRGKPDTYEITYKDGRKDIIQAHQVLRPKALGSMMWGPEYINFKSKPVPQKVTFHAEVNGRWTFILQVEEDQVFSIKNLTQIGNVPEYDYRIAVW